VAADWHELMDLMSWKELHFTYAS